MVQTRTFRGGRSGLVLTFLATLMASSAWAAKPKEATALLDQKAFFRPELAISTAHAPLEQVISQLPNKAAWQAFLQQQAAVEGPGASGFRVFIDPRSGTATNMIGAVPLIPGTGVGNQLTLQEMGRTLGQRVLKVDDRVVARAIRRFIANHRDLLGIDLAQLGEVRATQVNANLWQIHIPQVHGGVPVRDGRLAATISHGNLVVIGTEAWGNVKLDTTARIAAEQAMEAGFTYAEGRIAQDEILRQPTLEIIPVAPQQYQADDAFAGPTGRGYGHRLVWTYVFQRPPEEARWEVMVDAHNGEVIALQDINHYVQRQFKGGVYPLTSTEQCPNADQCGTMQANTPMPWANTGFAAPNNYTNSAGVYDYTSGTATTTLSGKYVRMSDNCGAVNESSATGDINLGGTNGQHDCTSAGASAGDTPASRSGFWELNKLAEQARGWLPTNTWLQGQLTANMNINSTCNAFWNGSTVNFYRSGGGCRNTGELAAVFDHEWGHGMDDFDANGSLSSSSEAYADLAAIYRLEASCVGHGFFWTLDDGCGQTLDGTGFNVNESQTGTHCTTDCSGVRDTDWAKHADGQPDTALGFVCTHCSAGTGPCGKQVHCSAAPVRQMGWDLVTRDLTAAPFSYDSQTAFIIGNKLFYQGSGNVGSWHACTCGSSASGCGATNGYMQWITADDDNGNLNDGTPHMTAIYNAYNRHGIACSTPTATNSGCAGGPTAAPTVTATAGNYQVALSWGAVTGATRYWVFRTEGHAGCNFGKAFIADVTGTSYTDTQVANGRQYHYNVVAAGSSSACFGRASTCVSATPTSGPPTPDFSLSCSPSSLSILQGSSGTSTCTVTSSGGFSSAVNLACASLPAGVTCGYNPNPVTPPANGSANSTLTVSVSGTAATGTTTFQAQGTSGATTRSFNMSLTVTATPTPDFSLSCSPSSLSILQGSSGTSTCTVASSGGFSSAVNLACASLPAGVTCGYNPNPVTPPANGSVNSTLTVSVSSSAATGSYTFQAQGTSGALTRSFNMSLSVTGTGGDLTAVYDSVLKAPKCATVGKSCDTGASLVLGRDGKGPEPNQPNTINNSCADGTLGTYHLDESNDRIKVSTTDGSTFAPGKTVRIDATVWAWASSPTSDKLDLYYAANANSPTWTLIATLTPTVGGAQTTLSATYTLPTGSLQAVRANFRYSGSASSCSTGGYDDRDDLIFAVNGGGGDTTPPTTSITSPANGSTVSGTISVTASASDNVGVTKVEFYIDSVLRSTDTTSPYSFSWNTTTFSNGSHSIFSKAYDGAGNTGQSSTVTVTVSNAPALTAVYDSVLKAPKCASVGRSCDSNSLVNGRDGKGPEPNQPNTINNSCADGISGTYHSDESNDRIKVSTVDGSGFAAGKSVRIEATVWAWAPSPGSDKLDLYYAANANSPTWTFLQTLTPTAGGAQTLTWTYTLPSGTLQAVRAQFRYGGTAGTCTAGGYNDRDDLIFPVQ